MDKFNELVKNYLKSYNQLMVCRTSKLNKTSNGINEFKVVQIGSVNPNGVIVKTGEKYKAIICKDIETSYTVFTAVWGLKRTKIQQNNMLINKTMLELLPDLEPIEVYIVQSKSIDEMIKQLLEKGLGFSFTTERIIIAGGVQNKYKNIGVMLNRCDLN